MEEIQDHCYLPEKWSTNKDHSKAERFIACEVAKVPRVTSKQLKASHTLANVKKQFFLEMFAKENRNTPNLHGKGEGLRGRKEIGTKSTSFKMI